MKRISKRGRKLRTLALQDEKKAPKLYKRLRKELKRKVDKRKIDKIIRQERSHAKIVRRLR